MIKLQKQSSEGRSFFQIFEAINACCHRAEVEMFTVTARRIWLRRNCLIHEGYFLHPNQLVREAKASLEEFQRANGRGEDDARQAKELLQIKWKHPPLREIKVNWDAALDNCRSRTGLGFGNDCTRLSGELYCSPWNTY